MSFQHNVDLILVFVLLRRKPELGGEQGFRRLIVIKIANRSLGPMSDLLSDTEKFIMSIFDAGINFARPKNKLLKHQSNSEAELCPFGVDAAMFAVKQEPERITHQKHACDCAKIER